MIVNKANAKRRHALVVITVEKGFWHFHMQDVFPSNRIDSAYLTLKFESFEKLHFLWRRNHSKTMNYTTPCLITRYLPDGTLSFLPT